LPNRDKGTVISKLTTRQLSKATRQGPRAIEILESLIFKAFLTDIDFRLDLEELITSLRFIVMDMVDDNDLVTSNRPCTIELLEVNCP